MFIARLCGIAIVALALSAPATRADRYVDLDDFRAWKEWIDDDDQFDISE